MNGFAAGVAALALSAVLVVVAASHTSVLVVDVALEDGPRVVAPVPYAVARAGLALAPRDVRRLDVPELADFADDLREILHILEDTPDETFLLIERPSEHVVVAKQSRLPAGDGPIIIVQAPCTKENHDAEHTRAHAHGHGRAPTGARLQRHQPE